MNILGWAYGACSLKGESMYCFIITREWKRYETSRSGYSCSCRSSWLDLTLMQDNSQQVLRCIKRRWDDWFRGLGCAWLRAALRATRKYACTHVPWILVWKLKLDIYNDDNVKGMMIEMNNDRDCDKRYECGAKFDEIYGVLIAMYRDRLL